MRSAELTHGRKRWIWARNPWLIQAARYSVTGVINTLVGLSVIFLALTYGASDIGANMLGYGIAIWVSFYLNRRWTFDYHGRVSRSLIRFVVVLAAAYCCNLAVVLVSHRLFEMNIYLAQVFGTGVYAVIGFLGSRKCAFAGS